MTSSSKKGTSVKQTAATLWLYIALHAVLYALWFGLRTDHVTQRTGVEPTMALTALCAAYGMALIATLGGAVSLVSRALMQWRSTWARRSAVGFLIVLHAACFLLVFIDTRVYDLLGVHLDSPWVLDSLRNADVAREIQLSHTTWAAATGLITVILLIEVGLWWGCRKTLGALQKRRPKMARRLKQGSVVIVLLGLVATATFRVVPPEGAEGVRDGLPGYESILGPHLHQTHWKTRTYPHTTKKPLTVPTRRPIVFILVESFRGDHLTKEFTPNLWRRTQAQECWLSPRHYSTAHTTELGAFAMLYGLHPYHYKPFASDAVASHPLTILRDNGYALGGASASQLRDWNNADFMVNQLDSYEEFLQESADIGDAKVMDWAKTFVTQRGKDNPYFLFLFLNSPHHNYHYPPEFERFTPTIDVDYDHFLGDDKLEQHRIAIHNRYRNSLLYVDSQIDEVVEFLHSQPGPKPIVVISGDHGEEFWDHGLLGHGASHFYNERIRVPLVLCAPDAPIHPATQLSSHVDLWPTIFDLLDGAQPSAVSPNTYSDGRSLLLPPDNPMVFVGGTTFPYDNPLACLIDDKYKIWLRLCRGDSFCVRAIKVTNSNDEIVAPPAQVVSNRIHRFETFLERFVTLSP